MLLLYPLLAFLCLLMLVGAYLCLHSCWQLTVKRKEAPFVPVPKEILPTIIRAMAIKKGSLVYDLGCGDGRVLMAAARINQRAQYIGIEKSFLPYFLARFNIWRRPQAKINIFRQDFFKIDLSPATQVFLYLFPEQMVKLLPKLEAELKPGTRVVSCDFVFPNKRPLRVIEWAATTKLISIKPAEILPNFWRGKHKLYVYQF